MKAGNLANRMTSGLALIDGSHLVDRYLRRWNVIAARLMPVRQVVFAEQTARQHRRRRAWRVCVPHGCPRGLRGSGCSLEFLDPVDPCHRAVTMYRSRVGMDAQKPGLAREMHKVREESNMPITHVSADPTSPSNASQTIKTPTLCTSTDI